MTNEATRIAIAEACPNIVAENHGQEIKFFYQDSFGTWWPCHRNDPSQDLNAMHAALMAQTPAFRVEFRARMFNAANDAGVNVFDFDAGKWAEVFLITKGILP